MERHDSGITALILRQFGSKEEVENRDTSEYRNIESRCDGQQDKKKEDNPHS